MGPTERVKETAPRENNEQIATASKLQTNDDDDDDDDDDDSCFLHRGRDCYLRIKYFCVLLSYFFFFSLLPTILPLLSPWVNRSRIFR